MLALAVSQRSKSSEQEEEHCPGSLSVPFLVPMSEEFLHVPLTSQGPPGEKEEVPSILQFESRAVFRCGVNLSTPWQILRAIGDRLLLEECYCLSFWSCLLLI